MGVGYATFPLDEATKQWLRGQGVAYPDAEAGSRWPTPNELRAVLGSLSGYRVSYRDNTQRGWDAEIVDEERGYQGWSATVWTKDLESEDVPAPSTFHKPRLELALAILEQLSRTCGPFVLVDDSSVTPVVVTPGADVVALAKRYG